MKVPETDEEIFEILKDEKPEDYEKVLRKQGVISYKAIRQAIQKVEKMKAEEAEKLVGNTYKVL